MSCTRSSRCPGEVSGNEDAQMHYAAKSYASETVIRDRCKILGWPEDIPFKPLSEIRGGVGPLLELRRRWNLPDGHKHKLQIIRATRENALAAARDHTSVHPNPFQLERERKEAARRANLKAAANTMFVASYTWHPSDLRFFGIELTTTQPCGKRKRSQRVDTCKRRARASDTSHQVRKKLPMRGITSMRYVIPGLDGVSGGGDGRVAKRTRLEDCPVDDPITEFELSTEFGGRLSIH